MDVIEVYHGSIVKVERPCCAQGRKFLDFGCGFYVTDIKEQAMAWARRVADNKGGNPILNIYHFNKKAFIEEGRSLIFTSYNREWLRFIVANRSGENPARNYDYIEGGVANDRVIDTINLFMQGFTDEDFALKRLAEHQPNNQICLLNQKLTDKYLTYADSIQL